MAKFKGDKAIGNAMKALIAQIAIKDQAVIRKLAKGYAEEAMLLIYKRTKAGRGVDTFGGDARALKPLSRSYKAARARFSGLHSTTSPNKSNLTRTGQMLDALSIEERPGGRFFIVVGGSRSDGGSNADVADWVTKAGRSFLTLSGNEIKQLTRSYRRNFQFLVKNGLRG